MPDPCASIQQSIQSLRLQIQQISCLPSCTFRGPHASAPWRPDPQMLIEVKALWAQVDQKTQQYGTSRVFPRREAGSRWRR